MAKINWNQITRVAEYLKHLPVKPPFNFYSYQKYGHDVPISDMYPDLNHPQAVNFFGFVCTQQYGFWIGDGKQWLKPLYGTINGKQCKGSDLVWKAAKRALDKDQYVFHPVRLATMTEEEYVKVFSDDNGPIPLPHFKERLDQIRRYGQNLSERKTTLSEILTAANHQSNPIEYFMTATSLIGGYNQDPLRKRNLLLAMILANRPEQYLIAKDPEHWKPILDYHLYRVALRIGLVELEYWERPHNINRSYVTSNYGEHLRHIIYTAFEQLIRESGHTMPFVDYIFWNARNYCPEETVPDCQKCPLRSVCQQNTDLFQVVYETTNF